MEWLVKKDLSMYGDYESSRHKAKTIQIQVPINPGNSGGPLFDKKLKLIGVNTFTSEGENLNFAIAVDDLIEFINEIKQEGCRVTITSRERKKVILGFKKNLTKTKKVVFHKNTQMLKRSI